MMTRAPGAKVLSKRPRESVVPVSGGAQSEGESRRQGLKLFSIKEIAALGPRDLEKVQSILRHGHNFGIWQTSSEWAAHTKSVSLLKIDLRERVLRFVRNEVDEWLLTAKDNELIDDAVLALSRYLVLCRVAPAALGRGRAYLKATTVSVIAYQSGPRLFAAEVVRRRSIPVNNEVDRRASGIEEFFKAFVFDDLAQYSTPVRGQLLVEIQRMRKLHAAGLWEHGPRASEIERSSLLRDGRKHNEAKPERKPYLPFPDEFVSQLAVRCLWLIHDVYPYFIELGEELVTVWDETKVEPLTDDAVRLRRDRRLRKILSGFEWYDRQRKLIESPPFPVRQRVSKGFRSSTEGSEDASFIWPPKNYSQVIGLFNAIQTAHLIVYFLSTGSRKSEVLTLKRSCIEYESDGRAYANGRLFKVVAHHGGVPREWVLPDIALTALEQQTYMGYLYEKLHTIGLDSDSSLIDSDNLWSRTSAFRKIEGDAALTEVNRRLTSFATYFDLDQRPGGQAIHSHRFRKTLARLVALSLKESPKVLMELFGHKSIEMTLSYILTDKDLQGDVEVVSRELIVMRAKQIIEDMVSAEMDPERGDDVWGGYGGRAAESLSSAITAQRTQFHERGLAWAVSGPLELAELLTLQGRCWEQVRHGVICTKLPSEVGPCNRNVGMPEPSKCDAGCTHRLEERFLKDDVDGAIRSCVEAYGQVMNDESSLSASHFAAQIRAHLPRFKDLEYKWSRHPVVKIAMLRGRGGGDE